MKKLIKIFVVVFVFGLFLSLASCDFVNGVNEKQTGNEITKTYEAKDGINELEIKEIRIKRGNSTYGPKLNIKKGDTKEIKITMQESLESKISVSYSSDKLTISGEYMKTYEVDYDVVINITGYVFEDIGLHNAVDCNMENGTINTDKVEFELSGASRVILDNSTSKELNATLSGASTFMSNTLTSEKNHFEFSGASKSKIDKIESKDIDIDLSGASEIILTGKVVNVDASLSGSSFIGSYNFICDDFDGDLSGASNAEITANKTIRGSASGASTIKYKGNAATTVTTSGGSQVTHIN